MGSNSKSPAKRKPDNTSERDDDKEEPMTTNGGVLSPRELRRRHRESLRAKATGKIDINSVAEEPSNKRIVFDDEDDAAAADDEPPKESSPTEDAGEIQPDNHRDEMKASVNEREVPGGSGESDDDDDVVEEVQTSKARETEQQKRLQERDSARTALQNQTKKRNRKSNKKQNEVEANESPGDDTNDFDDDFFKQLEQEKQTAKEEQKRAKKLERQSQGKHTSFVVNEATEDVSLLPTNAEGVQVAVLSQDTQSPLLDTNDQEDYARDRLETGGDGLSAKQIRKAKKRRKEPVESPSWQRSTKMNRLLAPGQRGRSRGKPASLFVKKK